MAPNLTDRRQQALSMKIADRLYLPDTTQAVLWDMDGVLIDSLTFALETVNRLIEQTFRSPNRLDGDFLRSVFPLDPPVFWEKIVAHLRDSGIPSAGREEVHRLRKEYVDLRLSTPCPVHPGILEILDHLEHLEIPCALVSNNPAEAITTILGHCGLDGRFQVIVGNDQGDIRKKPAPDPYRQAARLLGLECDRCTVIEDSGVGVVAGLSAGCHTIGVATGSSDYSTLEQASAHRVYTSFSQPVVALSLGDVTQKKITTPNEFVSHMVEHIAWRLGSSIDFSWPSNDYQAAGFELGATLRRYPARLSIAACLGMIDDGSAETLIDLAPEHIGLSLEAVGDVPLDWFLSLRCEQIENGQPLEELLAGIAAGLRAHIRVRVCSVEDPHHAWEGIFRSVGIAMSRIFTPIATVSDPGDTDKTSRREGAIAITRLGLSRCQVHRTTAESDVIATVDFSRTSNHSIHFEMAPTISLAGVDRLLITLADQAGFSLQLAFSASFLSSSHVLFEDTALVIGRALLELMTARMHALGAQGAGSNLRTAEDFMNNPIGVGVSIEGRKFWSFVPFEQSYTELRRDLLIGKDIYGTVRSEDLDDFIDGLSGGLGASIMIHIRRKIAAETAWPLIFSGLGSAIAEVFSPNPYRRGVPPGVKATLF